MKSYFILHLDSLCILEKMTDEQAGQFLKYCYQFHKRGELPEMDILMDMILTPFINQFKRDQLKYEKQCERNRQNASGGSEPVASSGIQSQQVGHNKKKKKNSNSNKNNETNKEEEKVVMPFGEKFFELWNEWKVYKKSQFSFTYKSQSEKAALNQLNELANDQEETAEKIVRQSMANGWKGFFPIEKNKQSNGKDSNYHHSGPPAYYLDENGKKHIKKEFVQ